MQVKQFFLRSNMVSGETVVHKVFQAIVSHHNERAGIPMLDESHDGRSKTARDDLAFLTSVPQIHQIRQMLIRAIDFGHTRRLTVIPCQLGSTTNERNAMFP